MGTVFVVSPCYLESLYEESKKFGFNFQGYGSFTLANSGIMKINKAELLGFAFVGLHLPRPKTKEYQQMIQFFDLCELMQSDKKFIIITEESLDPWAKIFKKYKHIRFMQAPQHDYLSDIAVNQHIFGSILLDNVDVYHLKPDELQSLQYDTPRLQYIPLFTDAQLACVSKVDLLDTAERTMQNDEVYQRFAKEGSYLKSFREYLILRGFGDSAEIANCLEEILEIIEKEEGNAANWCVLQAMLSYMKEIRYE